MLSPIVDLYIRRKAKKEHRSLPSNYKHILQDYSEKYSTERIKVHYMWFWDFGGRFPNASATIPGVILINSVWASLLVEKNDDEIIMEAFRLTIGHEMTHQEKDYFFFKPFSKAQKFVDWVNEVHADYGGIVKAFNGDVYRGIKALEFKEKCKGDKDKDGLSHPAWKRRREYVEKYDFNADLIKEIANFTGCNDKKLVESISNHYQGIELRR